MSYTWFRYVIVKCWLDKNGNNSITAKLSGHGFGKSVLLSNFQDYSFSCLVIFSVIYKKDYLLICRRFSLACILLQRVYLVYSLYVTFKIGFWTRGREGWDLRLYKFGEDKIMKHSVCCQFILIKKLYIQ